MRKEARTIVYDEDLRMQAYRLQGFVQPFPTHLHDCYVVGFMEGGDRYLTCKNRSYTLERGNIVLFNPGDSHACAQSGSVPLDYRAFNISREVMLDLAQEVTGRREAPGFPQNVVYDEEVACCLHPLHEMMMTGAGPLFEKEESLLLLFSLLLERYCQPFTQCSAECPEEVERACGFMQAHFARRLTLDQICREAGLSKSTLLRAFLKAKGVTPYRYLEAVRIDRAKRLLEQGVPPIQAALQTGFSDQSHFTNYFSRFTGLAPGMYRDIFSDKRETGGTQYGA